MNSDTKSMIIASMTLITCTAIIATVLVLIFG
jgi:hypothetical protein